MSITRTSGTNLTPNQVYELAKSSQLEKINREVSNISLDLDLSAHTNLQNEIDKLSNHISQLREQDFDGFYTDAAGKKVLVKFHSEDKNKPELLNPVQVNEADVQAMRYMRGMLVIAKNTQNKHQQELLKEYIAYNYKRYLEKQNDPEWSAADCTSWFAEECAKDISRVMNIKNMDVARKQVVMARDLAILSETHPGVCTISEYGNKVTIETSIPHKVREEYYSGELFTDIEKQHWFKNAKNLAGFKPDNENNWLNSFFTGDDFKIMQKNGVAVPPSARWLPIPANNQAMQIQVAARKENISEMEFSKSGFTRSGVPISYDVRKLSGMKNADAEQKKIAKSILMELIRSQLDDRIAEYQSMYGSFIDKNNMDFHINYQSMLSPLIGELKFNHLDNNAKFITMIKEVVNEIDDDVKFRQKYKNKGVNLVIRHTNAAVNHNAYLANEFSQDEITRLNKIAAFENTRKTFQDEVKRKVQASGQQIVWKQTSINQDKFLIAPNIENLKNLGFDSKLLNDLAEREYASQCLLDLLQNKEPYKNLDRYQRNIMMSALESLTMGSQSLTIAGCKNARDPTCIFASAVKVMKENRSAMRDWKQLESGIALSLKQGHGFRSMIFHSAIVKVSLIHKNFMKQLKEVTQSDIKSLFGFSSKLHGFSSSKRGMQQDETPEIMLQVPKSEIKPDQGMITRKDAEELLKKISSTDLKTEITKSKESWNQKINNFAADIHSADNLDDYLKSLRDAHLDTKSTMIQSGDIKVRTYNYDKSNINTSANDFLATGIDSARGAYAILQHAGLTDDDKTAAIDNTKKSMVLFQKNMSEFQKQFENANTEQEKIQAMKNARNEYDTLNSRLSKILVDANAYEDSKMAAKGMLEARDFLWILSHQNEAVCTIRELDVDGNPTALSFAKRIGFPQNDNNVFGEQSWFKQFNNNHPWSAAFIQANPHVLNLSATPMQRSTPNPANAWDEASILVNKGNVQVISGCRLGITSAYGVQDKEERQRLTTQNHQLMATDERLQGYINQHVDKWKGLLPDRILYVPILHQTLVDPGNPRYIANRTGENPRDMIKRKNNANNALQQKLDDKKIFYDKVNDKIIFDPAEKNKDWMEVKFIVRETNNGVNIHEKVTDIVDRDITDSRDLINLSLIKMELFRDFANRHANEPEMAEVINNLSKVISYLHNSSPARPMKMTDSEKEAMEKLCNELLEPSENSLKTLDESTRRNLALLMQASTNLASFLSNNTGINVIGYIRDGAVAVDASLKANDLNDACYKSCYERIMAELLGVRMGGCKSALDRDNEIGELTSAMYRQFNGTGRIHSYHDNRQQRSEFLEKYVSTQHKHNICEMATATHGSSDRETQGQAFHLESEFEKIISALFERGCRHPGVKKLSANDVLFPEVKHKEKQLPSYKNLYSSMFLFSGEKNKKTQEQKNINPDLPRKKV